MIQLLKKIFVSFLLIRPFKDIGFKKMDLYCGSIVQVIDYFKEICLDILNPVQTRALDIEPAFLKKDLVKGFLLMVKSTNRNCCLLEAKKVEMEVIRLLKRLGKNGVYIVSPSNAIQSETPIENILTFYNTARAFIY